MTMRSWRAGTVALLTAIGSATAPAAAQSTHRIDLDASDQIRAGYDDGIRTANEFMRLYPAVAWGLSLRGTYFFLRGDFAEAAQDLAFASRVLDRPDDMVFLFLARGRLGQDGSAELAAGAARLTGRDWRTPVIGLFLGRRTLGEMEAAAEKAGQNCQSLFYAAQWELLRGHKADAAARYHVSLDVCPRDGLEYGYAITELVRLAQ
jgi:hypothetical protein